MRFANKLKPNPILCIPARSGSKSRSNSERAYHESACDHDDDAAFSARGLRIKRLDLVFDLFER